MKNEMLVARNHPQCSVIGREARGDRGRAKSSMKIGVGR